MSDAEIASAAAAVVSAAAAVIGVLAAQRSAKSAHLALEAMNEAELRARLRDVALAAAQIAVEFDRVKRNAERLLKLYRELAIHAGGPGGSGQKKGEVKVAQALHDAEVLRERAAAFQDGPGKLRQAPPDDVDRVIHGLTGALVRLEAINTELSVDASSLEAQCSQFREAVIGKASRHEA